MSSVQRLPQESEPLSEEEIEARRRQREINQSAIDWLDSWDNATEEERAEQLESYELLIKALNEGRAGYRTFPE